MTNCVKPYFDPTVVTIQRYKFKGEDLFLGQLMILVWVILETLALPYKIGDSKPISRRIVEAPPNIKTYHQFQSDYFHINNYGEFLKVHYILEGNHASNEVLVCLHGLPFWSQSFHKMIPFLAEDYLLVIPDFVGFGKSDKYVDWRAYDLNLHKTTVLQLLDHLNMINNPRLNLTLVGHNWGSLLGSTIMKDHPHLFYRAVIMNTNNLPDGELSIRRFKNVGQLFKFMIFNSFFLGFRSFVNLFRNLLPLRIMIFGLSPQYSSSEKDEFTKPFSRPAIDMGGVVSWPLMVPVFPSSRYAREFQATRKFLACQWSQERTLILFSEASSIPNLERGDFIVGNRKSFYQTLLPKAKVAPDIPGGHIIMYDNPELVSHYIDWFINTT